MLLFKLSVLALFACLVVAATENVPIRCFQPGQCTDSDSIGGPETAATVDECIEMCQENERCQFFSYDAKDTSCIQFGNCKGFSSVDEDIVSGTRHCTLSTSTCFQNVTCSDAHVLDTHNDVEILDACYDFCLADEKCSYYAYDQSSDSRSCKTLASCPSYEQSSDIITTSLFCPLEEYNCYFNAECEGTFLDSMASESVEVCYENCILNKDCEWFYQKESFCTLLKTCQRRNYCPHCIAGKRDCPPSQLPNSLLHLGLMDGGAYSLKMSNLLNWQSTDIQPNPVLMPQNLDLSLLSVACWSSLKGIAVFCQEDKCHHYRPGKEEEWNGDTLTRLVIAPEDLTEAICTELPDGNLIITGTNGSIQLLQPSIESPPQKTTLVPYEVPDDRNGHCAILLDDTHLFIGFGSRKGAYEINIQNGEISDLLLPEIGVQELGCAMTTDPRDGKKKIMIVGGDYEDDYPIADDYRGLLLIDPEEWTYEPQTHLLPVEVHVPHKVRGTDLPLFISKSLGLEGSSYLHLFDFEQGWIEEEQEDFFPKNDFFGFALML